MTTAHVTLPLIVPAADGTATPYAKVTFSDDREPLIINMLDKNGLYLDDVSQAQRIAKTIMEAGLDIVPQEELQFATLTPEEAAVSTRKFEIKERRTDEQHS